MICPWDNSWDEVFANREWGKYPPEELVRFTARSFYAAIDRSRVKILDAGCGPGACSWYLAREGFAVYGLDGSRVALTKARNRLFAENLTASLMRGEFASFPFKDQSFDGVIDICAIQQNRATEIRKIFAEIGRVLKSGGKMFSMLLKSGSWGDGIGEIMEPGTFSLIPEGPFKGEGVTHFTTENELAEFLCVFSDFSCEISSRTHENRSHQIAHWVITATK